MFLTFWCEETHVHDLQLPPISHLQSIASQVPRFDTQHEADGIHKVWFPSSIRTLASTHLLVLLCLLGSSKICWYLLILLGWF